MAAKRRPHPPGSIRGILAYLAVAFGLAWVFWIPLWLLNIPPSSGVAQAGFWIGAFAPGVGTAVVRGLVTREGFSDAGLLPNLRKKWPYYVAAWLWPWGVFGLLLGLVVALGVARPDYSMGLAAPSPIALLTVYGGLLAGGLLYAPIMFGEEFGWRGHLQIRLFANRPLVAAGATGLLWGVWHVPAILAGLLPNAHGWLSVALTPWYTVWFSVLLGWVRLRTGSVWSACVAHSANNITLAGLGVILGWTGGMGDVLLNPGGVLVLVPIGLLCMVIILGGSRGTVERSRRGTRHGTAKAAVLQGPGGSQGEPGIRVNLRQDSEETDVRLWNRT